MARGSRAKAEHCDPAKSNPTRKSAKRLCRRYQQSIKPSWEPSKAHKATRVVRRYILFSLFVHHMGTYAPTCARLTECKCAYAGTFALSTYSGGERTLPNACIGITAHGNSPRLCKILQKLKRTCPADACPRNAARLTRIRCALSAFEKIPFISSPTSQNTLLK